MIIMKTFITHKMMTLAALLIFSAAVSAQLINVPGDYPGIQAALNAVVDDEDTYPAGSEITVKVDGEGYTVGYDADGDPVQSYLNFGGDLSRPLHIIIEGDGADVTTIRGFASIDEMPEIRFGGHHNIGMRFWQANSAHSGLHLTVKNIKLEKWGFGNTNGGVINFHQNSSEGMTLVVENVAFEHMMGRAGSVIQIFHNVNELYIDNIFVHNSIVFDNNTYSALFHINNVKEAIIANSTFMSNEGAPINIGGTDGNMDRGLRNGMVAWIRHGDTQHDAPMNVVVENNAFINNMAVSESDIFTIVYGDEGQIDVPEDIEQTVISFAHEGNEEVTSVMNVLMRNNILIENRRGAETHDVDVVVKDVQGYDHRVVLVYPEEDNYNILNAMVRGQGSGPEGDYNAIVPDGFKISGEYTYTHPDIDFEMDGELPMVYYDDDGVGYLVYYGDGGIPGDMVTSITLTADQDFVVVGETLQIHAQVEPENASDTSVTWSVEFGTGVAVINQDGLLTGAQPGDVTVLATANDGSGVVGTIDIDVVDEEVNVAEPQLAETVVYPVPSNGNFEILIPGHLNNVAYEVFDMLGNTIQSGLLAGANASLDISRFGSGLYLLKLQTGNQTATIRLAVQ